MTPVLLLTFALVADPLPAAPPGPAPVLGGCSGGCGSCGTGPCPGAADPDPMEKTGLFARLKKRLKKPFNRDGGDRPSLLGRLHGRKGGSESAAVAYPSVPAAGCGTCALPPIPGSVAPAAPAAPAPAVVPKPAAGESPRTGSVRVSVPGAPAPMPGPDGKPAF